MFKNTGIKNIIINEIQTLAKQYELEKVILFGSRARGDYHQTSDIDLATLGGNHTRFALDVDETTSTLLKCDIVNLDASVQNELRDSIKREGIIIYEKI